MRFPQCIQDRKLLVQNMEHMKIPLKDIKLATNDFDEEFRIGRGGFGKVYKAVLSHFDVKEYNIETRLQIPSMIELLGYPRKQSIVAIKRLDKRFGQGTQEFMQEISILPYFRHQNLVTLVGFCDEDHERILVYEYASNGSLDEYIAKRNRTINLRWALRLQICLDVARGLNFLHNSVGEYYRIIHRDVKSSNILLDDNWKGMISDFGLSKIGPSNLPATFLMTQVAGTFGYIDPLYQKTGMLTKETDVYSFGVVLFELLCGRLAHMTNSTDDLKFIPDMAKRYFNQKKIHEIVDPKLKDEFEKASSSILDMETCPDSVNIFAAIAYQCLEEKREDRPSIGNVVEQLDKALKSHEGFRQHKDEAQSSQGPDGPPIDEVSLWERIVGGWRKGRIFGFGTSQDPHYSVTTECSDSGKSTSSSSEINELREKLQRVEQESKTREDRYKTQLEQERKLRQDMVEEQERVAAELVEQIALTDSLAAFLQRQGYTPPPGPPSRPPPS
ncbi:hypothetical protein OSB04_019228 [Centaurea solstitialis]|uniref:Protein kinase domain-containing protein n=1 Tax=Centaurea solstitialis TaxID=347529 RepID=A0AA38T255_9ASTR|nr:hypothetical protein OSB04_019228 [Centaurea solstitialis]